MRRLGLLLSLAVFLSSPLLAQISTGSIAGTVTDRGAGVLTKAAITVTNKATGAARATQTGNDGAFNVPSLQAGEYDVLIASDGFQPTVTTVVVATGATTSVRIQLEVSTRTEAITVTGVSPLVDLESNKVQGVVGRQQIENLPLNGRSFLNLAALQPGVTVSIGNPAQFNAQFNVSVLGAPASRTAITVDGGNVRNPVEGGTGQNFSQEVVQEFQISTANFDLSTGIAAFGAINVVTRSGTQRSSAAPATATTATTTWRRIRAWRATRSPTNPDFSRGQGGVVLGGPIKKDKVHFFASYEYTDQNGVYVVQPDLRRWRRSARWRRLPIRDNS